MNTPCIPIGRRLFAVPVQLQRLAGTVPDGAAILTLVVRYVVAAAEATARRKEIKSPRAWFDTVWRRRLAGFEEGLDGSVCGTMTEQLERWTDRDLDLTDMHVAWEELSGTVGGADDPAGEAAMAGLALVLGHALQHPDEADCEVHAAMARGDWRAVCAATGTPPALLADLHRAYVRAGVVEDLEL